MIYQLTCGVCATVSKVESDIPSMEWECQTCRNIQTTSVPTDKFGVLLTDIGVGSIVAEKKDDVVGEVISSQPVGTKAEEDRKAAEIAAEQSAKDAAEGKK